MSLTSSPDQSRIATIQVVQRGIIGAEENFAGYLRVSENSNDNCWSFSLITDTIWSQALSNSIGVADGTRAFSNWGNKG
jgi:hypothetical protein